MKKLLVFLLLIVPVLVFAQDQAPQEGAAKPKKENTKARKKIKKKRGKRAKTQTAPEAAAQGDADENEEKAPAQPTPEAATQGDADENGEKATAPPAPEVDDQGDADENGEKAPAQPIPEANTQGNVDENGEKAKAQTAPKADTQGDVVEKARKKGKACKLGCKKACCAQAKVNAPTDATIEIVETSAHEAEVEHISEDGKKPSLFKCGTVFPDRDPLSDLENEDPNEAKASKELAERIE